VKLYGLLDNMTGVVEKMNGVRGAIDARVTSLAGKDSIVRRLRQASYTVDVLRKKIIATKEGGMVTGKERLRENLLGLYGSVVGYEGRPSAIRSSAPRRSNASSATCHACSIGGSRRTSPR
jgi:hypothetical protein